MKVDTLNFSIYPGIHLSKRAFIRKNHYHFVSTASLEILFVIIKHFGVFLINIFKAGIKFYFF